jgi:uncharacterized protein (DUF305 family)
MKPRTIVFAAILCAASLPAAAQHHGRHGQGPAAPTAPPGHSGHGAMMDRQAASPAAQAFAAANARMHKDMSIAYSGNADVDFARGMIPHHQGAVDMAEIVLRFGKDAEVARLARGVIAAQQAEIAQMRAWIARNGSLPAGAEAASSTKAYGEANASMHAAMTMAFTGNPDVDFIKGMIPHHEGAVAMARVLLQFGKDGELRKLGEDVVRTQSEEIALMKTWLAAKGG